MKFVRSAVRVSRILSFLTLSAGLVLPAFAADSAAVKRGEFLVSVGSCADCHMPFKMGATGPEKDTTRGLSGHPQAVRLGPPPKLDADWNWAGSASGTAFIGPWGTSYAANLTPDKETGIGNWKERDFIRALQSGQHVGATRPILPPMPWQSLARLPVPDLKAIFAYLKAQAPVYNQVPAYQPPAAP
ncbi:MAG TPA: diheme cytochrome c-553 [Accumulibacter sp.]|uniref:diheme cytochrome c-553 n=1 Tax=Accumulibacter sp. TaxID=2053492 RepID=UPI0025D57AE7|nr:diheme cytochrome c-553 [Accumulibacter sp.]MCM8600158.1 diheme cytochrome c-553 [Accumulibacter sp.]MCM8663981.1 diheme cytochrome c-553 [Accumulibacter sp.]HNC51967.1 diheme cytochrome c-553 [Accumulibacter sp.]